MSSLREFSLKYQKKQCEKITPEEIGDIIKEIDSKFDELYRFTQDQKVKISELEKELKKVKALSV